MKAVRRLRAIFTHTHVEISIALFAIVLLVPAAHAAATAAEQAPAAPPANDGSAVTTFPQASDAAFKPRIDGRISDRRSISGDGVRVRGLVTHAGSGHSLVMLHVRRVGANGWHKVAAKRVETGRKFTIVWRDGRIGRYLTRLTMSKAGKHAADRLGAVFVFRRSFASWYGPGFYGGRTACGNTLTASIVGVAHKTLPCGTRVTFYAHGRTVTARVIDRGPFAAGRDWDLTPALKRRLGFGSTGVVMATS